MVSAIVVFDLDGTLVDSAPDLVATLNLVLSRIGLPAIPYTEARNMVGGGARKLIERALAAQGESLPAAELDLLARDFVAHYAAHIADLSRPFAGLEPALDRLVQSGCRLAVCTNKLEWLARRLLGAFDLIQRFVVICGGDTFGLQKPDPELLRKTITQAGAAADRAIMVGDSINDIAMARAAGVPVIGVEYGYTDTPVVQLSPDRVITCLADVPDTVFDLLADTKTTPVTTS
jgi:phosphoglycolate phosphatase